MSQYWKATSLVPNKLKIDIGQYNLGCRFSLLSDDLVSTIDLGPTVLSLAGLELPCHLQGQAFLGPQAESPREYVYASRDRHDTAYDMVRAVRDKRFKYMCNYHPELPYLL